jgi:hypothetical protein
MLLLFIVLFSVLWYHLTHEQLITAGCLLTVIAALFLFLSLLSLDGFFLVFIFILLLINIHF